MCEEDKKSAVFHCCHHQYTNERRGQTVIKRAGGDTGAQVKDTHRVIVGTSAGHVAVQRRAVVHSTDIILKGRSAKGGG